MKAIVYTRYGSPEVLEYKEVEKPRPKEDEVLVKIHAASINSWDWDLLTGKPYLYRLLFGLLKPRKQIIGCDIAGRVEAVGKNIQQFRPGDEVFGDISEHWGGFAEYVVVKEKSLSEKPAELSFEDAAAIPQASVLALQCLCDNRQIKKGDKVLINGAGGGVGTFAVQMAKSMGAEVTCVDRNEKLEMLRSLGADYVIDYKTEDFTANGQLYDLIIDVVANRSVFKYKNSLQAEGTFVIVGGKIFSLLQTAILGALIGMVSNKKLGVLIHEPNKNIDSVKELIQSKKVIPVIDKTFPLNNTSEAFAYFGTGSFQGKIVISIR